MLTGKHLSSVLLIRNPSLQAKRFFSPENLPHWRSTQGFFSRNLENAYVRAWKILQERFGNPFILQKAFRDRLTKWPKISPTNPIALHEFADFLHGCAETIPHVKALAILNDYEENHKMLKNCQSGLCESGVELLRTNWMCVIIQTLNESHCS